MYKKLFYFESSVVVIVLLVVIFGILINRARTEVIKKSYGSLTFTGIRYNGLFKKGENFIIYELKYKYKYDSREMEIHVDNQILKPCSMNNDQLMSFGWTEDDDFKNRFILRNKIGYIMVDRSREQNPYIVVRIFSSDPYRSGVIDVEKCDTIKLHYVNDAFRQEFTLPTTSRRQTRESGPSDIVSINKRW